MSRERSFQELLAEAAATLGDLFREDEFRDILAKIEAQRQRELAEKVPHHQVSLTRINRHWKDKDLR